MLHNRHDLSISCSTCKVSNLCLAHQLGEDELKALDNIIVNAAIFEKNEHIYYLNDKADYLFAVHSGCCKEYATDVEGKEYVNNFYLPGDLMGIEAFTSRVYPFSAVALEPTQLCVIPINQLLSIVSDSSNLPIRLLTIFSNKIKNDTSIRLTTNAKQRVADFLLNMSLRLSERGHSPEEFPLPMPQLDVSNKIGVAFETVSRILHIFQKQDIISINGKRICIKDIEKLREISTST